MQHATFTIPSIQSVSDGDISTWQDGTAQVDTIHLKKTGPGTEDDPAGDYDLNQVLQYSYLNGYPTFIQQLENINRLLHGEPVYTDSKVYITCGSVDGTSFGFDKIS